MADMGDALAQIRALAVQAFGEFGADEWLSQPWRVFDNRSPLDLAGEGEGAGRVIAFLHSLCAADEAIASA